MHATPPRVRTPLAALLALSQLLLGCPTSNPPLAPTPGTTERREPNLVAVPGGLVDVAGGKLLVHRTELVLDTRLGPEALSAVWDSAAGAWRWSFESRYDGSQFVDDTGAAFAVGGLAPGAAVAGTWWVKLDGARMKTKGGLVHEYGAGGLLAARYWASDPYPRIVHRSTSVAGALRTTRIEQCTAASACTPLFTLAYDAAGRLIGITDRAGRRAEFGWDVSGRLTSARDPLDVEKGWPGNRYTYVAGRLASQTNSEGERVNYAYLGDALATATQQGPGAPVHRFVYEGRDAAGVYHTRAWTPLGEERRFAYDALGRILERHDLASGERTTWSWSGERIASRRDPNGALTAWAWSGDDVHVRTDPSGNRVSFSYPPSGVDRENPRMRPVAEVRDSLGLVEARSYDAVGRLVERRNGAGEPERFSWAQGMLASHTRAGVTRSFTQYGEHGHAAHVAAFGVAELRSFDAVGNLVQGSDGSAPLAGGVVRRGFDADRNLASVELAPSGEGAGASLTLVLEHRSDGQRRRVLRGGGDHELVYDAFGRLVEQRERAGGQWHATRFGWDAAGRPLWLERPNGMREEVGWGASDRPATVRRLRAGALESELRFTYQNGALARIDDSTSGAERYAYDAAGRRVATTFAGGERLDVAWDLRARAVSERFVGAQGGVLGVLDYAYDLADRRTRVADASGPLVTTRFAGGRVEERTTGNGLVRRFAYRADGVLTGTTTHDAAGALVEETALSGEFVWDELGNPVRLRQRAVTTTYGGVGVTTIEEYELEPAPGAEPTGARVVGWNDGLGGDEPYAFDPQSNLLAMGGTRFHYNREGNRLLALTRDGQFAGTYLWDAAGFATARNGVPLAWDAAGRLRAHGADTFDWDALGRLRSASVGGASSSFAFGGRVQADAAGAPVAVDLGDAVVGFAGAHRYRHLDFRGNVKFVTDDAGGVVAHYRYAPFGLDAEFGAGDGVHFAARPEIGELMLLGARVYDPAAGRFLSPDPLFQIVNQYAYTLGNPVWFADADGMSPEANASVDASVADGLALAGAALNVAGGVLRFAPTPQTVILGNALLLLGAILLLLAIMIRTSTGALGPAPSASGASSRSSSASAATAGGGGVGGGGAAGAGCSPAALGTLPDARGWLRWLLPLQLLLGWLLLRRRRLERGA
jgi:RHS repeat-associated protein